MTFAALVDRTMKVISELASDAATWVASVAQAGYDLLMRVPEHQRAVAALVAAASITVTLITLLVWPRGEAEPVRETMDAAGVRRMARRGMSTAEIARQTGMSHDAVATIIRAGTLTRSNAVIAERQSRPTSARSAGWLKLASLRK